MIRLALEVEGDKRQIGKDIVRFRTGMFNKSENLRQNNVLPKLEGK